MTVTEQETLVRLKPYTAFNGAPEVVPAFNVETAKFVADIGDERLESDSLDQLQRLVRDTLIGARVEVPFVSRRGRRGVMRGFHAGNRDILVTYDDGDKDRFDSHAQVFTVDTPRELIDAIVDRDAQILALADERDKLIAEAYKGGSLRRSGEFFMEALGEDLFEPWHLRK